MPVLAATSLWGAQLFSNKYSRGTDNYAFPALGFQDLGGIGY